MSHCPVARIDYVVTLKQPQHQLRHPIFCRRTKQTYFTFLCCGTKKEHLETDRENLNAFQSKSGIVPTKVRPSKDPTSRLNLHLIFVVVVLQEIERCFMNKRC